jgi:predicted metal-dependent phosphoesterase TrpH
VEPDQVAAHCRRLGLSPVFLTDHESIEGAVHLWRNDPWKVVVGQEVLTSEGELIGLFLEHRVTSRLPPEQAVNEIKAQGGLIYLQHPYDRFRRSLSEAAIERIADRVDIVEVHNGRSDAEANEKAEELCAIMGAVAGAGSDAHTLEEVGSVYVEMEEFEDAQDFLSKLRQAKIRRNRSRWRLRARARLTPLLRRP